MSGLEKLPPGQYGETERYHWDSGGEVCDLFVEIREVPEQWLEPLWELYDECLHTDDTAQQQSCYDRETFMAAMGDPDYIRVVLLLDGVPRGLILTTTNLDKAAITYINTDMIRKRYPAEVAEGRFMYITSVYVSPVVRNLGFIKLMATAPVRIALERDYVISCDVSDNSLFLVDMMMALAREQGEEVEKDLLGSQHYFAVKRVSQGTS